MTRAGFLASFLVVCCVGMIAATPSHTLAQTASEIQAKIDANKQQLAALEAEITAFQQQLDELGKKKNTLQSTISGLTLSQQQLATRIKVTENKISSANLQIQELSLSIADKETAIAENQDAIAKALRTIAESENASVITRLISSDSFSDAWREVDATIQFNRALQNEIMALRAVRTDLAAARDEVTKVRTELVALQKDLTLQKRSVDAAKTAQQQLLTQTKNQEANYQALIAQKKAAEAAFEQELVNLQSQLDFIVDPSSLPKVGSGVLSWPFSKAFMLNCAGRQKVFGNVFCVTQYFGNTPFSTANPQVYNGHGHNAIDIGASDGTPVLAALSGVVSGTGNTDLSRDAQGRQCYSFGKWVMIEHDNGLSTLYSHLSAIDVTKGQVVSTGQLLGLSGRTGYATGPHLHFGVYATQGTKIATLGEFKGVSGTRCASAVMPVASLDAYLNPLSYL